jgi:hypothetical protein
MPHVFSRLATLGGGIVKPLDWAVRITAKVNEVGTLETSLWQANFGYPLGTVSWTTIVDSRAQLAEQFAALGADQGFLDLIDEGQAYVGTTPGQDALRSIVHMTREPNPDGAPIGAVAEVITATPGEGKLRAAMAWGVEIAEKVTALTDTGTAFTADDYGPFGQVTWFVIHADAAACDAANATLNADEDYVGMIDQAGADGLFLPGGERGALTRIA